MNYPKTVLLIKIGVIIVLITILGIGISRISITARIEKNMQIFIDSEQALPMPNILPKVDKELPTPVQRYVKNILKNKNKFDMRGIRFDINGQVKLPGHTTWFDIHGKQYISSIKPTFFWNIFAKVNPILWVEIKDYYINCKGNINSKAFSFLPILSEHNIYELNKTQLVRWSSHLPLVPQAFVNNSHIKWIPVDDNHAIARIKDCKMISDHLFTFNAKGYVTKMVSKDRYEIYKGEGYKNTGSIIYRTNYKKIEGITIPINSEALRIENGKNILFLKETYSNIVIIR